MLRAKEAMRAATKFKMAAIKEDTGKWSSTCLQHKNKLSDEKINTKC